MTTSQISYELVHYNHFYPVLIHLTSIQYFLYYNLMKEGIHCQCPEPLLLSLFLSLLLFLLPNQVFFFYFCYYCNRDTRRITFLLLEYKFKPLFFNNLTTLFLLSLEVHMVISKTKFPIKFTIFMRTVGTPPKSRVRVDPNLCGGNSLDASQFHISRRKRFLANKLYQGEKFQPIC